MAQNTGYEFRAPTFTRTEEMTRAGDIRDKAEAVRVYTKLARKGLEIQNHADL